MKLSLFLSVAVSALIPAVSAATPTGGDFEYVRLDKNDTVLLIVDIQEGLLNLVRDFDPSLYRNNYLAHAALGKAFDLPVIMTTSAETGPNGRLPEEITAMYPSSPLIKRNGEVNAWDNEEFRKAVRDTGKSQVIVAGIVTDVCTAFLALSLRSEGYKVFANVEASGTMSVLAREAANDQMRAAGVSVVSHFAIVMDLMRDWRNTPGSKELFGYLDQYAPVIGNVVRGHRAAIENGTLLPGQETLPA
ncbi:isochorismatase family protein [Microdochium nivale]|nr:isochorismatase family protein [Microdochium nivale]